MTRKPNRPKRGRAIQKNKHLAKRAERYKRPSHYGKVDANPRPRNLPARIIAHTHAE